MPPRLVVLLVAFLLSAWPALEETGTLRASAAPTAIPDSQSTPAQVLAQPILAQATPSPTPSPTPTPGPSPTLAPSPRPTAPPPPPAPPPGPPPPFRTAPAPPSTRIIPGRSLAGIALGIPVAPALTRLGRPSDVRMEEARTIYLFDRFGLVVHAEQDQIIAVATTNSLMRTLEGIGPGSAQGSVTRIYGAQFARITVEGFAGIAYDGLGVAFGIDQGTVAVVMVYLPTPSP